MPRYMALDPGTQVVGVALSDPGAIIVSPLVAIPRRPHQRFLQRVKELIQEHKPEKLAMGLPLAKDGSRGIAAQKALALASELRKVLDIPIETIDESFTTVEAMELMEEAKVKLKKRSKLIDSFSAAIILERYLKQKRTEDQ
ncbi:MAG: Holliday junction resolvase RuvX [Deltaproteobacteria bacterium]|jgi:putative Holliday junction resolvase|nr:Holliday junction resolvase RuvX [Deltaproteobacteria bacterium]